MMEVFMITVDLDLQAPYKTMLYLEMLQCTRNGLFNLLDILSDVPPEMFCRTTPECLECMSTSAGCMPLEILQCWRENHPEKGYFLSIFEFGLNYMLALNQMFLTFDAAQT